MNRKIPNTIEKMVHPGFMMPTIMTGEVVSSNDPREEGRLLIYFPVLGGMRGNQLTDTTVDHFKWIPYAPMIGGVGGSDLMRGPALPGQDKDSSGVKSDGKVAYGWWAIPRKGATVFCFVANNDPNDLYWFACKYPTKSTSTLFGGRYVEDGSSIDGPFTDKDAPCEPSYGNQKRAFGSSVSPEWLSRGSEYNPTSIRQQDMVANLHKHNKGVETNLPNGFETSIVEQDGNLVGRTFKYTQGYARSRSEPTFDSKTEHERERQRNTDQNAESTMFGFTTPGGHNIMFDDRPENCRTKIRSATGHTILLDDTNDRIYINTNNGNVWIEADSNGHLYVYAAESISYRAEQHINLTAEKSIRMWAGEGIHMTSPDGEVRVESTDMHVKVNNLWQEHDIVHNVTQSVTYDFGSVNGKTGTYIVEYGDYHFTASNVDMKVESSLKIGSVGNLHIRSSGLLAIDGSPLAHNAGASQMASPSNPESPENVKPAFWTNITPMHEPWPRTFNGNKDNPELYTHDPEFGPNDPSVNVDMKQTSGDYERGPLWRR